jgi:DmsE family decaheme c-type cytochrome
MQHVLATASKNSQALIRLLIFICLFSVAMAAQSLQPVSAQGNPAGATPDAQYTADGTESCLRCHGGESMTVMAETAHGDAADPHAPYALQGCESCHGPGSIHISRARGGRGFPALLRFGDSETTARQTESCLSCHAQDMGELAGMEWSNSAHDTDSMTCVSCHQLHTTAKPMADRAQQSTTCAHCHADRIESHPRFEDKGIVFDKLTCFDCHDVHQLLRDEQ